MDALSNQESVFPVKYGVLRKKENQQSDMDENRQARAQLQRVNFDGKRTKIVSFYHHPAMDDRSISITPSSLNQLDTDKPDRKHCSKTLFASVSSENLMNQPSKLRKDGTHKADTNETVIQTNLFQTETDHAFKGDSLKVQPAQLTPPSCLESYLPTDQPSTSNLKSTGTIENDSVFKNINQLTDQQSCNAWLNKHYQIQKTIGRGHFSKVKLAKHLLTKELVAIKIVKQEKLVLGTSDEVSILECVHHPNIIRLYYAMETSTRTDMVMEYVPGGNLRQRLDEKGRFSEPEAQIIFAQLVSAVQYLNHNYRTRGNDPPARQWNQKPSNYFQRVRHWLSKRRSTLPADTLDVSRHSYLHVNPQESDRVNVHTADGDKLLVERYRIKLADFGLSKQTKSADQTLMTGCGSPTYAAPEIFKFRHCKGGPADIWALGIVLFFMLTGSLPYYSETLEKLKRLVMEHKGLKFPTWLSPAAKELYLQLNARLPCDRCTADQLIAAAEASPLVSVDSKKWRHWLAGQIFPKALTPLSGVPPPFTSKPRRQTRVQRAQTLPTLKVLNTARPRTKVTKSATFMEKDRDKDETAEMVAIRRLRKLGVTYAELATCHDADPNSAILAAYRIMLHCVHKERRLSHLPRPLSQDTDNAVRESLVDSKPDHHPVEDVGRTPARSCDPGKDQQPVDRQHRRDRKASDMCNLS